MKFDDFFLLKDLPKSEKKQIICDFPASVHFKKGEIVYSAQHFSNAIGYIIKGTAVANTDNSNCVHLKTFQSGMTFGAAAVFGKREHYISTITAKTELDVLFITEDDLRKIFTKYPQTAVNYICFLTDKVRFLNEKLNLLSCTDIESTVLKYIISLADDNGETVLPKNMTLISKTLGISRVSLYRALNALETNGSIIKTNNIIKVINYEKTN